ncbi:hypothetical protein NL676_038814 [Syzygium grande]|nr:hypothetical protein NL676_038814 [Syzygium grande]
MAGHALRGSREGVGLVNPGRGDSDSLALICTAQFLYGPGSCEPVTAGVPPSPIGSRGFPARARIGVQIRRFPAVDCGGGRGGSFCFAGVGAENSRGSELGLRGEEDLDVVLFGRVQLQEEDVQESAEEGPWARDQGSSAVTKTLRSRATLSNRKRRRRSSSRPPTLSRRRRRRRHRRKP